MNQRENRENIENACEAEAKPTSTLLVALYWLFVGLPLVWGIYHTVLQAAQLFR